MARILFYIYALTDGGAERVVATLASGLAERGHAVTLATDYPAPQAAGLVSSTVRTVHLGRSHATAVLKLTRLLRTVDVSISALGVCNLKHAAAALLAGRARRAVLSFHGHMESEPGRLSRLGNGLAPVLTRLTGRSVFVSDALLRSFEARGIDPSRSVRIHNPVAVRVGAERVAAGPPTILGMGRLVPLKRFNLLLQAFAQLADPALRLTIVGDGPERAALASAIRTLGLAGRVDLVGWTPNPQDYFGTASCFVLSSARESFSNVVVEALGYGIPVVATDCGGPREILADGRFGRLVAPGDAVALAQAIRDTLADPGDPAPRRSRAAEFSPEKALDHYEALIETVIGEVTAGGAGRL